jgi:predicted dehydrogenase
MTDEGLSRRAFLEGAAVATLAAGLLSSRAGADEAADKAEAEKAKEQPPTPVNVGLIGAGVWGKEIARMLATIPNAQLKTVADSAASERRKVKDLAPAAEAVDDYKKILDDAAVTAVIVATPTYLHKQIVLDAIAAGKHVYCEAPLAVTTDDLTAICQAARGAKTIFQPGLQRHCHGLNKRVVSAMDTGTLGTLISIRSQSRKSVNWYRPAATPERTKERSWQIYRESSLGTVGELGIHQLDIINWLTCPNHPSGRPSPKLPKSVSGVGSRLARTDGDYEVPDTTFVSLEYPDSVYVQVESSIATSHGGNREEIVGAQGTIFLRDAGAKSMGYFFAEAGRPTEGWEPYAKRETVEDEIGIILRATPPGGFAIEKIEKGDFGVLDPLNYSLGSFLKRTVSGKPPLVGWVQAFEANVIAIKAAEAVASGKAYAFKREDFVLA